MGTEEPYIARLARQFTSERQKAVSSAIMYEVRGRFYYRSPLDYKNYLRPTILRWFKLKKFKPETLTKVIMGGKSDRQPSPSSHWWSMAQMCSYRKRDDSDFGWASLDLNAGPRSVLQELAVISLAAEILRQQIGGPYEHA